MEMEMKVNSKIVRSLREERAWSQEHLAQVAGVSLRTIQRIEADGTASAETRMALASAFGVSLSALSLKDESGAAVEILAPVPAIPVRYKIALVLASVAAALTIVNQLSANFLPVKVSAFCLFIAISLGLYGGFGCYFHAAILHISATRRAGQFGFIFLAIFAFFAAFSTSPGELMAAGIQMAVLASSIYFGFAYYFSRKSN